MDPPRQLPELEVLPDLLHHTPLSRRPSASTMAPTLRAFSCPKPTATSARLCCSLTAPCARAKRRSTGRTLDGSAVPTVLKTFTIGPQRHVSRIEENLLLLLRRVNTIVDEAPLGPRPPEVRQRQLPQVARAAGGQGRRAAERLCAARGRGHSGSWTRPAKSPGRTRERRREQEALQELKPYFIGSFGSPQRLDYGTGHELSFLAFLACLWKLGCFNDKGLKSGVSSSMSFET